MRISTALLAGFLLGVAGCGANESMPPAEGGGHAAAARPAFSESPAGGTTVTDGTSNTLLTNAGPKMAGARGESQATPDVGEGLKRKIIYRAEIGLTVEDFAKTEPQVERLVQGAGGYIAEMELLGSPGSPRSARWTVRIPVERFEKFVRDIAQLGELEKNQRKSEDVTEKYYDIEARIKNKKVEEERLVKLLADATGKLEEILKVEGELSRVRGEIEQLQGVLRVLQNLTSLTTVTITIQERKDYKPAEPAAPSFGTTVARTFQSSVDNLIAVGKAIVLVAVAIAPWLPIILIAALVVVVTMRKLLRPHPRASSPA
jgi:hypothetical protein